MERGDDADEWRPLMQECCCASLPVSRDPKALQIHTQAECDAAAENLEQLVRRWETELVPLVEAVHGPGARWFDLV